MRDKLEFHHLFHGELLDSPGCNDPWDEFVSYTGNNRWVLKAYGPGLYGSGPVSPLVERMSTKAMIRWCLDRDEEDPETYAEEEEEEEEGQRTLGKRIVRLREIAAIVGATYCARCLDGLVAGTWPPKKRVRAIRVLSVRGVTRRGIWWGISVPVFDVETNFGPAYLHPPDAKRVSTLFLKSENSTSGSRMVVLSKANMIALDSLRGKFEAICRAPSSK